MELRFRTSEIIEDLDRACKNADRKLIKELLVQDIIHGAGFGGPHAAAKAAEERRWSGLDAFRHVLEDEVERALAAPVAVQEHHALVVAAGVPRRLPQQPEGLDVPVLGGVVHRADEFDAEQAAMNLRELKGKVCEKSAAKSFMNCKADMSDIGAESVVSALEVIIEKFDDQIMPHAAMLVQQLCESFMAYASEGSEDDEAAMAARLERYTAATVAMTRQMREDLEWDALGYGEHLADY